MSEEQLLFIISQPRSGSTLLQKIISSDQKFTTCAEPWWLLNVLAPYADDLIDGKHGQHLTQDASNAFIEKIGQKTFQSHTRDYILTVYSEMLNEKASFFLDKTPRYYEILPQIEAFLPKSKKIFLIRHPLDVLNSIIDTWIDKGGYLGHYYRDICIAPFEILNQLKKSNSNEASIYYERAIANPNNYLPALLDKLNMSLKLPVDLKLKSKEVQGNFGDQGANKDVNNIISGNIDKWKEKIKTKKWGNFIKGYAHFLGPDFFAYHNYEYPQEARQTKDFNLFLEKGKKGLHKVDVSKLLIDRIKVGLSLK